MKHFKLKLFILLMIALIAAMGIPLIWASMIVPSAVASEVPNPSEELNSVLRNELSKVYGGARITLSDQIRWVKGGVPRQVRGVMLYGDDGRGNSHFSIQGDLPAEVAEGWVGFSAWIPARIAVRRILPGEPLNPNFFTNKLVDVATGQAHEYRGVLLPEEAEVKGLETIQTILEGQFLLSSAVRRVPDVRRGDMVRVQLVSGDLLLSTQAMVEEPAYLNGPVRVMTTRGKRELSGLLKAEGVVEVKL